MFHTVILAGRLSKDVIARYTPEGKAVATLNVAVDDGFGDNKKTIWLKVTTWEKTAEACGNLKKGEKVLVEGRLQHENGNPRLWEKDGKHGASFEIVASNVRFLSGKGEAEDDFPL